MPRTFDEVWRDIASRLENRRSVSTLAQGIKNDVISVEPDHIKVRSEKTGKIRKIPGSQFEQIWNSMVREGLYVTKTHEPYVHSQIICAILSLLDYVEVKHDPLTIYLKQDI